jgi:hypothetical protein
MRVVRNPQTGLTLWLTGLSYPVLPASAANALLLPRVSSESSRRRRKIPMSPSPPEYQRANPEMLSFRLLPTTRAIAGPRLGRLVCKNVQMDTPTFIAPTSRGVVPHLSMDNLRDHTDVRGVYVALEDCTTPSPTVSQEIHLMGRQLWKRASRNHQCSSNRGQRR